MKQGVWPFIKQHRVECICFAVFIILAVIGFCVHEPSYDEAQAWMIAKTATWKDLFFLIPFYEGHPPFWHLLLAGPARLGASLPVTAGILGLILMLANGYLLFFKAPFPRWVRCLLPFNFFLFFQYGIIVRPYGLMCLLILLLAMYFPQKDKRPGLFVGLLAALCACHLFGMAIAGGITLAWLWEMKDHRPWKTYLPALRKDKRFHWLLGLLGWTLLILACIAIPRAGMHLRSAAPPLSIVRQAIYVLLAMPAEAVLTNIDDSFQTTRRLIPWLPLLSTAAVGLVLWGAALFCFPRKNWRYLVFPYLCMSIIMLRYSSCHHVGMVLILFIGYAWINLAQTPLDTSRWPQGGKRLAKAGLLLMLLLPAGWNFHSLYWDYKLVLYPGKEMVEFLKKYNLTDQTIFVAWVMKPTDKPDNYSFNTNAQPAGTLLGVYLDHNIFANFHDGQKKSYIDNFCPSYEEMLKVLNHWREDLPVPTVLINRVPMDILYKNPDILNYYRLGFTQNEYQLWKFNPPKPNPQFIFLFYTLWDKYQDQLLEGVPPEQRLEILKQHEQYTLTNMVE